VKKVSQKLHRATYVGKSSKIAQTKHSPKLRNSPNLVTLMPLHKCLLVGTLSKCFDPFFRVCRARRSVSGQLGKMWEKRDSWRNLPRKESFNTWILRTSSDQVLSRVYVGSLVQYFNRFISMGNTRYDRSPLFKGYIQAGYNLASSWNLDHHHPTLSHQYLSVPLRYNLALNSLLIRANSIST
jgi:hypothetical protein